MKLLSRNKSSSRKRLPIVVDRVPDSRLSDMSILSRDVMVQSDSGIKPMR